MKKHVLILSNSLKGLFSFRKEVIKAICDAGYDVTISIPVRDERAECFESIGCSLVETKLSRRGMNPLADIKLMLSYRTLIRKIHPIAVLTYTIKPNVYGGIACRLTGAPQLANVTGLGDAVENGGWLQKLTITLYKIGLAKAKTVFFQNATNRNYFLQHKIAKDDSVLLPGSGVNLNHHIYQTYPADNGIVKFLFIGRLLKDKGIEELFEAAKLTKQKYPNTVFQILGPTDGAYQNVLEDNIKAGIVEHFGSTTDVRPFIGDVHCTVMPSYHEGMSNVNLESSANGRPVITTNVAGCRETVDDNITGFLVNVKDAKDLANKLERFILLPYEQKEQMGKDARKKVEREFDRQIVINSYLKEIEAVSNV